MPKRLRLRLRQFRPEDTDAMHECFADPEAMRFWNTPVHAKRIQTERAVSRFIDCTPAYYRFWAVADSTTDRNGIRASQGQLRDNLRVGDEWRDDLLYALLTKEGSCRAEVADPARIAGPL